MKGLIFLLGFMIFSQVSNAAAVTAKVTMVGSGWGDDLACVYLATGDVVRLDLTTQKARAELSIGLAAKATNSNLYVYFDDTLPLEGGCNTGTTIKPHGMIRME